MTHKVTRYHDISCGHRVVGHEGKCRHLHGHNYRIHFTCCPIGDFESLDHIGRVIDFGEIKRRLCIWLEDNWDHRFLIWDQDPLFQQIKVDCGDSNRNKKLNYQHWCESFVELPFNPTAENMAEYLVTVIGPEQLKDTAIKLVSVTIEETAKCHATYDL